MVIQFWRLYPEEKQFIGIFYIKKEGEEDIEGCAFSRIPNGLTMRIFSSLSKKK